MVKNIIPASLNEALELLNDRPFKIMAGGTGLMVQRRAWSQTPPEFNEDVLYIFNLEELKYEFFNGNPIICRFFKLIQIRFLYFRRANK